MHEFRRFIEQQLAAREWRAADLVRASGMRAQQVSKLLTDNRDVLPQMPSADTLAALKSAFTGVPIEAIRAAALRGMGVPNVPEIMVDLDAVDDDLLIAEVRRRMQRAAQVSSATIATMTDEERDRAIAEYMRAQGFDVPDSTNPATKRGALRAVSESDGTTTDDRSADDGDRR